MSDEITFPRADIEYMKDALENSYSLSLSYDLQDQIRGLKARHVPSKLTKMIEMSVKRLEEVLADDQQNGSGDQ